MRILCLTSRLPYPPNRGNRLRAFRFVEHLSREHELTLVSFIANESEREHVAPLRAYCREVRVVPMSPARSALSVAARAKSIPATKGTVFVKMWTVLPLVYQLKK